MNEPDELRGERVVLRPATPDDLDALLRVLQAPEVACWWGDYDRERAAADLLDDPESHTFAVIVDGAVEGLVQYYEEEDPQYRHAGIDVSLHPSVIGRGLGADTVRTMVRYLVEERGHHRLVIDPAASNERAIACYRRVGFKPVGVMRQYEQAPDGTWHDGLLMDLLADELR
jgi:aminoglycoside 6'-N-acetyltransferase